IKGTFGLDRTCCLRRSSPASGLGQTSNGATAGMSPSQTTRPRIVPVVAGSKSLPASGTESAEGVSVTADTSPQPSTVNSGNRSQLRGLPWDVRAFNADSFPGEKLHSVEQ